MVPSISSLHGARSGPCTLPLQPRERDALDERPLREEEYYDDGDRNHGGHRHQRAPRALMLALKLLGKYP